MFLNTFQLNLLIISSVLLVTVRLIHNYARSEGYTGIKQLYISIVNKNKRDWVDEVLEKIRNLSKLSQIKEISFVQVLEEYEMEVNNGGHHQYYSNSSGNHHRLLLKVLETICSPEISKNYKQAAMNFPAKNIPTSRSKRQEILAVTDNSTFDLEDSFVFNNGLYPDIRHYIELNEEVFRNL